MPLHANIQDMTAFPAHKHRHRHRHFLAAWVRAPLKVGALVPSSRALARAMAAEVNLKRPGAVIELGAGTGVVTHALVEAGITADNLLIIEREPRLHAILSMQFHSLNIICADASDLGTVLTGQKVHRVNAIVSSLPLLSMPKKIRHAIEQQMAAALGDNGMLIQFTYGPRSPISVATRRKFHLTGRRVKMVIANIPPAHVWLYQKNENIA